MPDPDKVSVQFRVMLTKSLQKQHIITTCATCEHYDKPSWTCNLFKQQPPVDVVVVGCGEWSEGLPY